MFSDDNQGKGDDMSEEKNKANSAATIEDDPIKVRRAKREVMIASGEFPYGTGEIGRAHV